APLWFAGRLSSCEFRLATTGFFKRKHDHRQQQTRQSRPNECVTPAPSRRQLSTYQVTQGRAQRNSRVKDRQGIVAPRSSECIRKQTRANRRVTGLSDTYQNTETQEACETGGKASQNSS